MGLLVEVTPDQSGDLTLRQGSADQPGDQSFVQSSHRGGPLHLEPVEALGFPDRIRGIEAIYVQGSGEMCVQVTVQCVCVCVCVCVLVCASVCWCCCIHIHIHVYCVGIRV